MGADSEVRYDGGQPSDVVAAIADGRIRRTFSVGKVRTLRDLLVSVATNTKLNKSGANNRIGA